jgi:hypothetical protein
MRRKADGDTAFRTTQARRHPALASPQHQGQRTRPEACGKVGTVRWQMQIKPSDLLWIANQQQKGFPRWPPLHAHEGFDRLMVHRGSEAVHRLRGIGEHAPLAKVVNGLAQCGFNFNR